MLTFTRAVAASWMVSLLDLMNRVQLNILGRHLYLQSNILDARQGHHSSYTAASGQIVSHLLLTGKVDPDKQWHSETSTSDSF